MPDAQHQHYRHCQTCGAILGYTRAEELRIFFYAFACPPRGAMGNLAKRRVNGRIEKGDVFCPHCHHWQSFDYLPQLGVG